MRLSEKALRKGVGIAIGEYFLASSPEERSGDRVRHD
jgi:hypothetical protein